MIFNHRIGEFYKRMARVLWEIFSAIRSQNSAIRSQNSAIRSQNSANRSQGSKSLASGPES